MLLVFFGGISLFCSAQDHDPQKKELDVVGKDIIVFNFRGQNLEQNLKILNHEHFVLFRGSNFIAIQNDRLIYSPMRLIPYTFINGKDTMIIKFYGFQGLNYYIDNICFRKGKFAISLFNNDLSSRALYNEVLKHKSSGRDLFNKEESTNILFKGAIARPEYKIKNLQLNDAQFIRIKPSDRYVDFRDVK